MKRLIKRQAKAKININILFILLTFFTFSLTCLFTFAYLSYAGISNTVHNMSTSAPPTATIKAVSETEICVFCHIPHNAQPGRPLWNHDMPATGYTMYTSEYLHRAGYTLPSGLGTATGEPGMLSRQCLSCHDGTVAVGAVYMVRGTILGAGLIAMSGVTGTGTIPTIATGFIGGPAGELGNLTRHHPVGIEYNSTITIAFGSGSRTIELIANPTSTAMKLYNIGGTNYVECSSCHDPHIDTGYSKQKFLRDTTGGTLAAKISNTCSACHSKTGWTGSIHQTAANAYLDASVNTTFDASTISSLVCMNCHRPHKGLGAPYLLRQAEETTCFQGASGSVNETACHGSSATATTNKIQTVITRTYKHPTTTISAIHTNLDVLYPTGGTPAGSKGLDWATSRHAECVDCHNPHRAKNIPARVGTASWYPTTNDATSNLTAKSGALTGVTGVEPGAASIWTVPTTFTTYESATKEYQVCFKCHSYWALRDGDGITTYTTASGATVTDQAMEFNPNNKSAHPVVVGLSSQTGSTAPKPLAAAQMSTPWATNIGTQTMYCSDCHGTDSENAGDPKGPHGSSYKYMLKGTNKYWPTKSDGTTLYTLNDFPGGNNSGTNTSAGLFCLNCHPMYSGTTFFNNVHKAHNQRNQGVTAPCIRCHILVPHGGKMSRLIGDNDGTMPARYAYLGTISNMYVRKFTKAATPTGYQRSNCYSSSTGCSPHNNPGNGTENW